MTWYAKLSVGLFAGLCAVLGPRLISLVVSSDPTSEFTIVSEDYLSLAVILAALIGGGVMILEWNNAKASPRDIFTAAIGFPAIIAGGLNLSSSVQDLTEKDGRLRELSSVALRAQNVEQLPANLLTPLSGSEEGSLAPPTYVLGISLIGSANAQSKQTLSATPDKFAPGKIISSKQYFIVLKQTDRQNEAVEAVKVLKSISPDAIATRGADGKYYILESTRSRPLSDATLQVLKLKSAMENSQSIKNIGGANLGIMPAPKN